MDAAELLRSIVDHCTTIKEGSEGALYPSSPLIVLARELLSVDTGDQPKKARLAPRVGLSCEEKDIRRKTLGSSEIAAVAEVNPYETQHNVWLSKVHDVDFEGNEATVLGQLLEPAIFGIYSDRYGRELVRGTYTVGPEPWMSCTPDARIVGVDGLVEAKLVGLRSLWMWGQGNTDDQESDAVPLHYLCQAQWQMACTGASFVDVAALMGTEFRTYRIRSNAEVQAKLIAKGRAFWEQYVIPRKPPPVDGSEGASKMLKALYPRGGRESITADESLEQLVAKLEEAREELDRATTEKRRWENEIKAVLKDASGAHGTGWKIRYSETKAKTRPFCFEPDKEKGKAA